jgi:hypothetical protein
MFEGIASFLKDNQLATYGTVMMGGQLLSGYSAGAAKDEELKAQERLRQERRTTIAGYTSGRRSSVWGDREPGSYAAQAADDVRYMGTGEDRRRPGLINSGAVA